MKRSFLVLLVLLVFGFAAASWGQCPQDPNDLGVCDTMYIEAWQADLDAITPGGGPFFVRVPIYVTTDVAGVNDSISAFIIPLCYHQKTNVAKYCSLGSWWNNTDVYPWPTTDRSIFKHIDTVSNWMMTKSETLMGLEWDTRILTLSSDTDADTAHFWLSLFPTGTADQRFESGSRILLCTMTFLLEDTMTICIDTCFWPPASQLEFTVLATTQRKIPRPPAGGLASFEYCFSSFSEVKEIETTGESRPTEFSLSQNYPNPFNPVTNFRFTLAKASQVRIEIYNIVGQRVRILVDEEMKPGVYLADWDSKDDKGNSVSSGIYFYRMTAGDFSDMKKMLLVK